jgi:hypothetical protein
VYGPGAVRGALRDPDGRGLPGSERENGEESWRLDWAGWATRGEKKQRPVGLGRAGGKGERGK